MFYERHSRLGDLEDLLHVLEERTENAPRPISEDRSCALELTDCTPLWSIRYGLQLFRSWLSLGSSITKIPDRATNPQQQSALISKLPPELRRIIWQQALGGKLLHITRAKKKLLAINCPVECPVQSDRISRACWGLQDRNTRLFPGHYLRPFPGSKAVPGGLLSLSRTCHAMLVLYRFRRECPCADTFKLF